MSHIERVEPTWWAWQERDMDGATAAMAPDVVHDLSHYDGWPGEPVQTGVGPALALLGEWMAWWSSYRQDLVRWEEHDERVLAEIHHVGTRDGARIEEDIGILFFMGDDGRIARWEVWSDLEEARRVLRGDRAAG
jgi:ketosteroid isomerase-like protein